MMFPLKFVRELFVLMPVQCRDAVWLTEQSVRLFITNLTVKQSPVCFYSHERTEIFSLVRKLLLTTILPLPRPEGKVFNCETFSSSPKAPLFNINPQPTLGVSEEIQLCQTRGVSSRSFICTQYIGACKEMQEEYSYWKRSSREISLGQNSNILESFLTLSSGNNVMIKHY